MTDRTPADDRGGLPFEIGRQAGFEERLPGVPALRVGELGKAARERKQAREGGLRDHPRARARGRGESDPALDEIEKHLAIRAGRVHVHPLQPALDQRIVVMLRCGQDVVLGRMPGDVARNEGNVRARGARMNLVGGHPLVSAFTENRFDLGREFDGGRV